MLVFDTLQYTKNLRAVGVPQEQAEVHAESLKKLVENDLATKHDLKELEVKIENRFAEIKRDIKESEMRMTIRLGSLMAFAVTVVAALVKLL